MTSFVSKVGVAPSPDYKPPLLRRLARALRPQDFAWVLFVAVLLATSETNYDATILLVLIGGFQIIEPRLKPFSTRNGQIISVVLKLLLSWLLIGWSHTIFSPYHSIFFIPVISAAVTFELPGVLAITAAACALYFSFLLPIFIDWSTFELPPDYLALMGVRAAFFAIVAVIVFEQAKAKRVEMARTSEAADRLAEANADLRRTQVSLRRSERLAALGQLTAGLAHELRNPLGTIRASAEMLNKQASLTKPELVTELADYIRTEADRMNGLVAHFLDFARPLQIHASLNQLRAVLDQVEKELKPLADSHSVRLEFTGDANTMFTFDADLLRLALSNLVQNAIQATPPEGLVQIDCAREDVTMRILVRDTGSGIAPEHLESIFNPFFTTKPKGVGLGLAIVAKIVDEHGGTIRATSTVGHGTTFELNMPTEITD